MIIIYLITNKITNKNYVGQTVKTLEERWQRHCWNCTINSSRMPIGDAIKKYGKENFEIKQIDMAETLENANEKEVYWANYYNCFSPNGYNLKAGGRKYIFISEETRKKIGDSNRGKKASPETIKRLSESHKGFKVSEETKLKLSMINKGKKPHENTRRACSLASAKKYLFLNPEGKETEIYNMRQFCIKNGLCPIRMCKIINKKFQQYKGWKFIKYL